MDRANDSCMSKYSLVNHTR
uniref:Uncharacterized protein n=1 Tax=Anguilla anguilla TaxID=7936 RepID=A0A0E9QF87_ANGAN